MRAGRLLTYRQPKPGKLICTLDLSRLYPESLERDKFEGRLGDFLQSDPDNPKIYECGKDRLVVRSEQLVPKKVDRRPPLLMVFGNPAPQSVVEGMFFAYEGKGREHRFWKHILGPSGILEVPFRADLPVAERCRIRKKEILDLVYDSPFKIGLCVYVSFPSTASGPWSGINGIRRLFGQKAMRQLELYERARVLKLAKGFLANQGFLVTFQKDAWNGLRSEETPEYSIKAAKNGFLRGSIVGISSSVLWGLPPTRLTGPCRRVLKMVVEQISR